MKLDYTNGDVWSSENTAKQFSFSSSPVVFKILSDSLYSDKVGSIVREIASNAIDAHKAAGKADVPIEISIIDTNLFYAGTSVISIKDYGIGLSEDEIYNVYTVYGNSLKRDTNELIGGYGIGSKSPFAYTETFTISSVYNGTKTIYTAYIGSDGYPLISKMLSNPTDESNGLEVIIPIKSGDTSKFVDAVRNQLGSISPKPVCIGFNPNWRSIEETYKGSFWRIIRGANHNAGFYLNIGGFYYPIYLPSVLDGTSISGLSSKWNVVFDVNIGDVDLSASRESLAYTQKTISYIKELFDKFSLEACNTVLECARTKSEFDTAYLLWHNLPFSTFQVLLERFHPDEYTEFNTYNFYTKSCTRDSYNRLLQKKEIKNLYYYDCARQVGRPYHFYFGKTSNPFVKDDVYKIGVAPVLFCNGRKVIARARMINHLIKLGYAEAIVIHGIEKGCREWYDILDYLGNPSTIIDIEAPEVIKTPKVEVPQKKAEPWYDYYEDHNGTYYKPSHLRHFDLNIRKSSNTLKAILDDAPSDCVIYVPLANGKEIVPYDDCDNATMIRFMHLVNHYVHAYYAQKISIRYLSPKCINAMRKQGIELSYEAMKRKFQAYAEKMFLPHLDKDAVNVIREVTDSSPSLIRIFFEADRSILTLFGDCEPIQRILDALQAIDHHKVRIVELYAKVYGADGECSYNWEKFHKNNPILAILDKYNISDKDIKACLKKYLVV